MEPVSLAQTIIRSGLTKLALWVQSDLPRLGGWHNAGPAYFSRGVRTDGSPQSNPQVPPIVPSGGDEAAPTAPLLRARRALTIFRQRRSPAYIIANNTGIDTTASEVVDEPMEMESGQDDREQGRAGDIGMEEGAADEANTGATGV